MILGTLEEKLSAALNTIAVQWQQQLQALKPAWREWAMMIPSNSAENSYLWMNLLGGFREWVGERHLLNVKGEAFVVKNKEYEKSFDLPIPALERGDLGMLRPLTDGLVGDAVYEPQNLLEAVQLAAFGQLCYDGQYYFDTDHPHPSGDGTTFANLITTPLDELNGYAAIWAVLGMFAAFTGANKNGLNLTARTLVTGPGKLQVANELLKRERNAAGASNTLYGMLQHRVNPQYVGGYAGYWHVEADTPSGALRPWLYQEEKAPEPTCTAMNATSPLAGFVAKDVVQFLHNKVLIGADFRGAATFTMPQLAIGSTGTGV